MKRSSRGLAGEFPESDAHDCHQSSTCFACSQPSLFQTSMMALAWTALTLICVGLELYLRFQAARHGGFDTHEIDEAAVFLFGSWPGFVHVLVGVCLINLSVALWRVAVTVMEHVMQGRAQARARSDDGAAQAANTPNPDAH